MHSMRLSLLLLSSFLAMYLGCFHFGPAEAATIIVRWGYWWTLFPVALFIQCCWKMFDRKVLGILSSQARLLGFLKGAAPAIIFLLLLWLALWSSQEKRWKVVMDEPVLAATALSMHEDRQASYAVNGFWMNGEYISSTFAIDKRPMLFPFLVSAVHDLIGYDPANPSRLNGVLLFLLLILLYLLGTRLAPPYGGYLACLLFATVPLLPAVATTGIFDLLNQLLIVLLTLAACLYLRSPSDKSLNFLLLTTALLAHARYESVLFAIPVGALVVYTWWREKQIHITRTMLLVPLFYLPFLLQRKIIEQSAANWHFRQGAEEAFSLDYLGMNLASAWRFIRGTESIMWNSILLTILSLMALPCLAYWISRRESLCRDKAWAIPVLIGIGSTILFNLALLMFYHWGQLDDIVASRLALPGIFLQLMLVLIALGFAGRRERLQQALILLTLFFFLVQTRPAMARNLVFSEMVARSYAEEVLEFSWQQTHRGDLVLALNSLPAYLGRTSTLGVESALQQLDRIVLHQVLGTFDRIFVIYMETTPMARSDATEPIRRYAETASKIQATFDLSILERERINDALYLVKAEVNGVFEEAYTPLRIDFGSLTVDQLGKFSAENEALWDEFTRSLPQ